jgi:hypothetical protein
MENSQVEYKHLSLQTKFIELTSEATVESLYEAIAEAENIKTYEFILFYNDLALNEESKALNLVHLGFTAGCKVDVRPCLLFGEMMMELQLNLDVVMAAWLHYRRKPQYYGKGIILLYEIASIYSPWEDGTFSCVDYEKMSNSADDETLSKFQGIFSYLQNDRNVAVILSFNREKVKRNTGFCKFETINILNISSGCEGSYAEEYVRILKNVNRFDSFWEVNIAAYTSGYYSESLRFIGY